MQRANNLTSDAKLLSKIRALAKNCVDISSFRKSRGKRFVSIRKLRTFVHLGEPRMILVALVLIVSSLSPSF